MMNTTKRVEKKETGKDTMSQSHVVSIGGIDYDSHSGLPVEAGKPELQPELRRNLSVHAKGVHAAQQRSTALNRQFVKKTQPVKPAVQTSRPSVRNSDIRRVSRSPHISKFARDPKALSTKRVVSDIGPVQHPTVAKVQATAQRSTAPVTKHTAPTAQQIKHAAIGQALANAKPEQKPVSKSRGRAFNVAAASLGLLLIAGYFTYVNLPNLSVRVAAAQAGIDATYPEYRPIGYRLDGPVAYKNGEVSMNFASNSGPVKFDLSQSKSNWDSAALLENYVSPKSDGKYATYSDNGLTIYTYGTDAAWVNGGILYTVDGTAMLSNEQIRRIATSM
jgi:hypothetical protein